MKQLTIFILIFGVAIFAIACKKNNQNNINAAAIVGKWNNISTYESDGTHLRSWTGGQYITFREDKTFDEYGNMFDFASPTPSSAHGGTYSIDDSLHLMWSNGRNYSFKVQTLTISSLVLRKKYDADFDVLWDYSK